MHRRCDLVNDSLSAQSRAEQADLPPHIQTRALDQAGIEIKYAGYIKRQDAEIERVKRHESIRLPSSLDYASIEGLSNELREKLEDTRPVSLARAARVPGITPAALSLLMVHAKKSGDQHRA